MSTLIVGEPDQSQEMPAEKVRSEWDRPRRRAAGVPVARGGIQ
jgi:hypothetical protein